jgi:hypothetical protein
MTPSLFSRSGLLVRAVVFCLACVFCLPGGAVLVEIVQSAIALKTPTPVEGAAACVAAIVLAACLAARRAFARGLSWGIASLGHAALANSLVPDRPADTQLIWLGAGAALGAVIGLLIGSSRQPGGAASDAAADAQSRPEGPASEVRWRRLRPGQRALLAAALVTAVVSAIAVRDAIRVTTQARIAEAVARDYGHAIYDNAGTPTLLFKWRDVLLCGEEHLCLRSVELGSEAGNEELAELAEIGLGSLPYLREVRLRRSLVTDDGIPTIAPLQVLERISLGRATTDAGLAQLDGLPSLRFLDLSNTRVTGEGLRSASRLPALLVLNLQETRIADGDLPRLKAFPLLVTLDLSGTPITDSGLVHLTELPNLSCLILMQTRVTDAGFTDLAKIQQLRWLFLTGSRVSRAGLNEFHRLRPGVWTD